MIRALPACVTRGGMSKGAAAKETVVRITCLRYGCVSLSDDEADALFTLEWALHEFSMMGWPFFQKRGRYRFL